MILQTEGTKLLGVTKISRTAVVSYRIVLRGHLFHGREIARLSLSLVGPRRGKGTAEGDRQDGRRHHRALGAAADGMAHESRGGDTESAVG